MPEDGDGMIQLSHEGWMHTIKISKSGEIEKEEGATGEEPTVAVGEKKGKEACEASKLRMSARSQERLKTQSGMPMKYLGP